VSRWLLLGIGGIGIDCIVIIAIITDSYWLCVK